MLFVCAKERTLAEQRKICMQIILLEARAREKKGGERESGVVRYAIWWRRARGKIE